MGDTWSLDTSSRVKQSWTGLEDAEGDGMYMKALRKGFRTIEAVGLGLGA